MTQTLNFTLSSSQARYLGCILLEAIQLSEDLDETLLTLDTALMNGGEEGGWREGARVRGIAETENAEKLKASFFCMCLCISISGALTDSMPTTHLS